MINSRATSAVELAQDQPLGDLELVVTFDGLMPWRRLHEHPSTKAEKGFLPIVEGRPLMLRPAGGPPAPYGSGADGIAIGADGSRLFYSPLMSRQLYSVSVDALLNRSLDDEAVVSTVVDEGDKDGGGDGQETV